MWKDVIKNVLFNLQLNNLTSIINPSIQTPFIFQCVLQIGKNFSSTENVWTEVAQFFFLPRYHQKGISFSGLRTTQDARFYGISAKFDSFSNEGKTLVIQFTVKHEQNIDCGGGYVKVYPKDVDQKNLHGDSPYYIMFGRYM